MNYDDPDFLDPEARALEARLGALVPKGPSDEFADRLFAAMDAGEDPEEEMPVPAATPRRAWWSGPLVPMASAAAVALFVALQPTGVAPSELTADVDEPVVEKPADALAESANVPALPHGMLARASLDQEVVNQDHEYVSADDESAVYRKVSQFQMEKVRFVDPDTGSEVIVEVPCEQITLEKVDLY
ncbi:hypothetical protein [Sulfuriroseicoccus oceanibius]|uniref:Uncharacterized protein n=1 Tax=Sulfuriroseicoccus oceanibius TaxID=2707525 RepID=A0A6B3L7A7_9BACT|nr:hypothetical protein [Sulfuriroseicoccus oceanibius]QQL46274.1 hypothetical protein G3M56_006785 [Sulfuriroseicoccus oceanibius]